MRLRRRLLVAEGKIRPRDPAVARATRLRAVAQATRLRRLLLVAGWLALVVSPGACGSDERLMQGMVGSPDAGTDQDADARPPPVDSGKDVLPLVRTVETRPRFGALDPSSYLLDGDFEQSGMDAMQYVWFGLEHDMIVTGARCRSGLRCAEISGGQYIAGVLVWPASASVDLVYHARPSSGGDCAAEVAGVVASLADYPGAPLSPMDASPTDPAPAADGWCKVTANLAVPSDTGNTFWALILWPAESASGPILIDDATLRVPGAGGSSELTPRAAPLSPPSHAKLLARVRSDFAKRPPVPPRAEPVPVVNRTARRR